MTTKDDIRYAMSRRRLNILMIVCAVFVFLLMLADRTPFVRQRLAELQRRAAVASRDDVEKYHEKSFLCINVVDGDTIDINVPDGKEDTTRIRLLGVDTPETKKPAAPIMYFGPEATAFTIQKTLGKEITVYLNTEGDIRGKYGRLLAYVLLEDGRFLNELLILEGYGYADLRFDHLYYHKYIQLEAAARTQKKGLWENAQREQLPEWLQKRKPNLLKEN